MDNNPYVVKGRRIQIDWLKGSTDENLYRQYILNAMYLSALIEQENETEVEKLNRDFIQKIKRFDPKPYQLSEGDQHKNFLMEKKSKRLNKTLKRSLKIEDLNIIQVKESGSKSEKKQFPIPQSFVIELRSNENSKQLWMKDAHESNARINISFVNRKPISVYVEDVIDASKIRDAFICKSILSQHNFVEAIKISREKLRGAILTAFKDQLQKYVTATYKENEENKEAEEQKQVEPYTFKPGGEQDSDGENKGDLSESLKFGMMQYKEEVDEEELEQELNNFDVSKSFQKDERDKQALNRALDDSQIEGEKQNIVSDINLEDGKNSALRLNTNHDEDNNADKNNQLTIDIDTRLTAGKERPKDINAETITQQVNERYSKFCKNLILEHAVEELNHVSQENHPMKMVGILKQTIQKLKEGIKVIMFLCNERKNMVSLIENQEETIEKQITQMNQMNLSEKLSALDENFFKNQLLLLNGYLKQFYHFVQNCQKSIEILEKTFKYNPEWRQDPRYKNQNILTDMEELPKHCFKIHTYHNDKLKEVKKLYEAIVKQDENEVKYIEYIQADIKQTVEVLKPLSEHFEHNSTIDFEILFFLFIEDVKQLNDKFQSSYSKQQENINQFKKSYEDVRNFYYQRLQKILELKYSNGVTRQKLTRVMIPYIAKQNNAILTDGLESIQQVDKQLDQIKLDLNQPMNEGAYFQQIKLYEEHKAQQIIKDFENEIATLKQVFQTVTQIEIMEKTIEKLMNLREAFDNEEIEEEQREEEVSQYKQLISVVEQYSKDMNALIEISPVFRSFHSKLCSEIQLSNVVLEVIDLS